ESRSWGSALFSSPVLWGGLFTVGFYALIPYWPVQRELAQRYFCSHPLEYATATLFFVGVAILGLKALRLRAERAVLRIDTTGAGPTADGVADPLESIGRIAHRLEALPGKPQATHLGCRLR